MKQPVRVAVTGAAGQIGYALLFRIASGEMLGKDQPVILQLLEMPHEKAQAALKGVMMELDDCAFPLLAGMVGTDDAEVAFKDADIALLVGARPRGPGMERKDLLLENAKIFTAQGKALEQGRVARRQGAGGRQPGQHQRLHRDEVGAGPQAEELHRDAAPGPQPRAVAARQQGRRRGRRHRQAGRLGQPLADDVSGLPLRHRGKRHFAEGQDQRRRLEREHLHPARSASAARRSSKRAACRRRPPRPTPPSTTSATGCSAATASG